MNDNRIKAQIHQAVDYHTRHIRPDPFLAQRILRRERTERKMIRRLPIGLFFVIVLLSMMVTALAAMLLSPREVVERVAVPAAQNNQRESYSYAELSELLHTLNENGITLDEGSTLMRAFEAGRGYWEKDTLDEICRAAFGRDQGEWTLEQKHWYGEMMVAIGATSWNAALLPEEGEITLEQARALAADTLKSAYGVALPTESDESWRISESLEMGWNEEMQSLTREQAKWHVWYINRRTGNLDYDVFFDRFGQNAAPWRARYMEAINGQDMHTVLDDLESREGSCSQWGVEIWAEFGELIREMTPTDRNCWLYQHAGYRLPPDRALTAEQAAQIAREATEGTERQVQEHVICCTDGGRPIYKVCQRVFPDGDHAGASYDAVWCVELDCMTGEVLAKQAYTYGPDSDPMMMYVPFSLLSQAPIFEKDPEDAARDKAALASAKEEAAAEAEYGLAYMYFLPLEKQAKLFGAFHTVPTPDEYDHALAIAQRAVAERYGEDALETLGDYQIGVTHQVNGSVETGEEQHVWDFLFTTDPTYLSDGYRVQFRYPADEETGAEGVLDLTVEHANIGNG